MVARAGAYPNSRLHGRLVHDLGSSIVRGDIAPGTAIPTEDELATEFGASRTAVREAVKVLAGKGLVLSRTSAGTRVQDERAWNLLDADVLAWRYEESPTLKHLEDLAALRLSLEPEAARIAAENVTDSSLAAISEALDEMRATMTDVDAFIAADLRFHQAIVEASGNELFIHIQSMVSVAFSSVRQLHTRSVRRNRQTLPDHELVLDAIRDRDSEMAVQRMRSLAEIARSDVKKAHRAAKSPRA